MNIRGIISRPSGMQRLAVILPGAPRRRRGLGSQQQRAAAPQPRHGTCAPRAESRAGAATPAAPSPPARMRPTLRSLMPWSAVRFQQMMSYARCFCQAWVITAHMRELPFLADRSAARCRQSKHTWYPVETPASCFCAQAAHVSLFQAECTIQHRSRGSHRICCSVWARAVQGGSTRQAQPGRLHRAHHETRQFEK